MCHHSLLSVLLYSADIVFVDVRLRVKYLAISSLMSVLVHSMLDIFTAEIANSAG